MKHLVAIMAVFLLMGCQTTENTPKDNATVKPVDMVQKKSEVPEEPVIQTAKPIMCAQAKVVHDGLTENSEEKPFLLWQDVSGTYFSALWMNKKSKTITVVEYPNGPNTACFVSVGTDAVFAPDNKVGISINAKVH